MGACVSISALWRRQLGRVQNRKDMKFAKLTDKDQEEALEEYERSAIEPLENKRRKLQLEIIAEETLLHRAVGNASESREAKFNVSNLIGKVRHLKSELTQVNTAYEEATKIKLVVQGYKQRVFLVKTQMAMGSEFSDAKTTESLERAKLLQQDLLSSAKNMDMHGDVVDEVLISSPPPRETAIRGSLQSDEAQAEQMIKEYNQRAQLQSLPAPPTSSKDTSTTTSTTGSPASKRTTRKQPPQPLVIVGVT